MGRKQECIRSPCRSRAQKQHFPAGIRENPGAVLQRRITGGVCVLNVNDPLRHAPLEAIMPDRERPYGALILKSAAADGCRSEALRAPRAESKSYEDHSP